MAQIDYKKISKYLANSSQLGAWAKHSNELNRLESVVEQIGRELQTSKGQPWKKLSDLVTIYSKFHLIESQHTQVYQEGLALLKPKYRQSRQEWKNAKTAEFEKKMKVWQSWHVDLNLVISREGRLNKKSDLAKYFRCCEQFRFAEQQLTSSIKEVNQLVKRKERAAKVKQHVDRVNDYKDKASKWFNERLNLVKPEYKCKYQPTYISKVAEHQTSWFDYIFDATTTESKRPTKVHFDSHDSQQEGNTREEVNESLGATGNESADGAHELKEDLDAKNSSDIEKQNDPKTSEVNNVELPKGVDDTICNDTETKKSLPTCSNESVTSSKRSEARRLAIEARKIEAEAKAALDKKQRELQFARQQRELESQRLKLEEEYELKNLIEKHKLDLDFKKLELEAVESSRGSTISSFESFSFHEEDNNEQRLKNWLDIDQNEMIPDNDDISGAETSDGGDAQQRIKGTDGSDSGINNSAPNQADVKPKSRVLDPSKMFVPQSSSNLQLQNPTQEGNPGITGHKMMMKLPKLKIAEFSGDPLEWPEWSGIFTATVHSAPIDDSLKMNHLKTLVTGKAKAALAGLGFSGQMYAVAWDTLERNFGRPQLVVNAQLRQIHAHPFVKSHDSQAIIRFSHVISNCVNVLTQFSYEGDLKSESVLNSALRKLPPELRSKWLFYVKNRGMMHADLCVFKNWLSDIAFVHDELLLQFPGTTDKKGFGFRERPKPGSSFVTTTTEETKQRGDGRCPLSDGFHRLWSCDKFKAMKVPERYEVAKKMKLCFSCLNEHLIKDCKSKRTCGVDGCEKKHNRLLHSTIRREDQKTEENATVSVSHNSGILPLVHISVSNGRQSVDTLALCDTGSTVSFIDASLKSMLKLHGKKTTMSIAGINVSSEISSELVSAKVASTQGNDFEEEIQLYSHPSINVGNKEYNFSQLKRQYEHLRDIPNETVCLRDVKVVLGQDAYHLHRPTEYKMGSPGEPWSVKTQLGWTLSGPLPKAQTTHLAVTSNLAADSDPLAEQLKRWWDIETYATVCNVSGRSREDKRALSLLQETTKHNGERYEVGLLWADDNVTIPNNFGFSMGQLVSLEKRLAKDDKLRAMYQATIDVDIENNFARKVSESELKNTYNEPQWYLPHHPVINPHKPEKVRRVCNAAAKYQGSSLNDKLIAGPDLLQSLVGIIFRFREHKIAMTADIDAMFLQVLVPPSDCNMLRFLWRNSQSDPVGVYEYTRHVFGAKSSPTCANYALQRTGHDNKAEFPDVAHLIERNFYMDDFVKSVSTTEEAQHVYRDLVTVLNTGGFKLRKWLSNSIEVMESIPEQNRSGSQSKTFDVEPTTSSILGLKWNVDSDTLEVCRGADAEVPLDVSQRIVLSFVSAVFDPLGIFSPFTMRMRLLLKRIWTQHGQSWDETISDEDKTVFLTWTKELPMLKESRLQRKYFSNLPNELELHVFADASLDAMCIVAYLSGETQRGREVAFVLGKCRVAPMRQLSIPKLELQAALYSVRLRQLILDHHDLEISSITHWTDSVTVLQWLHSAHKKQNVFVANRVAEIMETSTIDQWRHVKGTMNPADIGTRGMTVEGLKESEWLNGPAWLKCTEDEWPSQPIVLATEEEVVLATQTDATTPVIDWERFSKFSRLINTVAYCLRLAHKESSGSLSVGERRKAEMKILQLSQKESFTDLLESLQKSGTLKKSAFGKLCPFLDEEGIIRLRGRLKHSAISYEMKYPMLLNSKHPAVKLMLESLHREHNHEGTEYVRSVVQQKFWIIGLRNALRDMKSKCVDCRKRRCQTMVPFMADLPPERTEMNKRPFTNTGVDYFGPFEIKLLRRSMKRWCCLFTCLTTRAVHIEVTHSLDTESCLAAISRFIARRGKPETILSDNGTNFVGAARELRELVSSWNQKQIEEAMAQKNVTWKFNPPGAPHFGGVWERLVRSCKKAMFSVLGSRSLSDEILTTTMCLVEQTLNARPLTSVSNDPDDLEALTPNHFLLGEPNVAVPYLPNAERYSDLRRMFRTSQCYADMIWKRWANEYLPQWNTRPKWSKQDQRNLQVGDLVWLVEEGVKRSHYKMARVVEVYEGRDGVVRSALIKTKDGKLKRPAAKLAPLFYECFQSENRAGDVGASSN